MLKVNLVSRRGYAMSRCLPIAVVQAEQLPTEGALEAFAKHVEGIVADFPEAELLAYPELFLCGLDGRADELSRQITDIAEPLTGPRMRALAEIAGDLRRWIIPGTIYERSDEGHIYNTTAALSPDGKLVASYRKIFPWRPFENCRPGNQFVTFDIADRGRIGLSICYDTWFPEVSRHLAWMGAEVIVAPTMTRTSDRPQELVLTQANAIANQVFAVSVNGAAPHATGRSLVVGPEGHIRHQAGENATVISDVLDLDEVTRVRRYGTVGLTRVWDQFAVGDSPLPLPLYAGHIDPATWSRRDQDRPTPTR